MIDSALNSKTSADGECNAANGDARTCPCAAGYEVDAACATCSTGYYITEYDHVVRCTDCTCNSYLNEEWYSGAGRRCDVLNGQCSCKA